MRAPNSTMPPPPLTAVSQSANSRQNTTSPHSCCLHILPATTAHDICPEHTRQCPSHTPISGQARTTLCTPGCPLLVKAPGSCITIGPSQTQAARTARYFFQGIFNICNRLNPEQNTTATRQPGTLGGCTSGPTSPTKKRQTDQSTADLKPATATTLLHNAGHCSRPFRSAPCHHTHSW